MTDESPDFSELLAQANEPSPGPWFAAYFDGECNNCGARIEAGDDLRADGHGNWEGKCCGE